MPKPAKTVESCGFATTPLYPVGTRFLKHFEGYAESFEGRVTAFDGEYYEVYYPKDGDQEVFDASGFDSVEILIPHKRPTRQITTKPEDEAEEAGLAPLPTCPICTEVFSADPCKKTSGNIPVQSRHCAHVICLTCVDKIRTVSMMNGNSVGTRRAWVDCPMCKGKNSFHADEPTICLTMCEMVGVCQTVRKQQQDAKKEAALKLEQGKTKKRARGGSNSACSSKQHEATDKNEGRRSSKAKRHRSEATNTSRSENKTRVKEEEGASSSSLQLLTCSCCSVDKVQDKFSAKQWERAQRRDDKNKTSKGALCRRCEAKQKLKKEISAVHGDNIEEDDAPTRIKTEDTSARIKEEEGTSSSSSLRLLPCSCCSVEKVRDKFSSKQWERAQQQNDKNKASKGALCRRCEAKLELQKEIGAGHDENSLRIYTAKRYNHQRRYLTIAVPWCSDTQQVDDNEERTKGLPRELILDGYTREPWSLFTDDTGAWTTICLRSVGHKLSGFLAYLKERKKSAYGTFVLPTGEDGFFVLPLDQPQASGNDADQLFFCKCVLGLGLVSDITGAEDTARRGESQVAVPEDYVSSSILGKLLDAQRQTASSLAVVPKGSVKINYTGNAICRPRASGTGGQDWFRPRTGDLVHSHDGGDEESEDKPDCVSSA